MTPTTETILKSSNLEIRSIIDTGVRGDRILGKYLQANKLGVRLPQCRRYVILNKTVSERFWEKVDKTPGHGPWGNCWVWTGAIREGYGAFKIGGNRTEGSHRIAWQIQTSIEPDGLLVCHACDYRACVNIDHLFLGTYKDNFEDMLKKCPGRQANFIAARPVKKAREIPEGMGGCSRCQDFFPREQFSSNKSRNSGLAYQCRKCGIEDHKRRRLRRSSTE